MALSKDRPEDIADRPAQGAGIDAPRPRPTVIDPLPVGGARANAAAAGGMALLVFAEPTRAARLSVHLAQLDLRPIVVSTARAARAVVAEQSPTLILCGEQLPDADGARLCLELAQAGDDPERRPATIVIADQADSGRIVQVLRRGVDDYLADADDPVLVARVQALLHRRRHAPGRGIEPTDNQHSAIVVGDITIRPWAFNVLVGGRRIDLTVTQFRLLLLLAQRPGHVVRPDEIQAYLAQRGSNLRESSVKSHVYFLRRKLGPAGRQIENLRRVGYRLRET
jgi:DNA-binding response OmpR family regulator